MLLEFLTLKKKLSADTDFAENTVVHLCAVTFPQREVLAMQVSGTGK